MTAARLLSGCGDRCRMTTNATPLSAVTWPKNSLRAVMPPAKAPIPTTRKWGFPPSCAAGLPEAAVVSSLLIDGHAVHITRLTLAGSKHQYLLQSQLTSAVPANAAILPPFARRRDFDQVAL